MTKLSALVDIEVKKINRANSKVWRSVNKAADLEIAQASAWMVGISQSSTVAIAASSMARHAREQLRDAANADFRESSWDSAIRLDAAFEAVEKAERRAQRFGGGGPYALGSGHSFFRDLLAESKGNTSVHERLQSHHDIRESRAGLGITSSFDAPAFSLEDYADIARQDAVFSALIPQRPLPKGSTLNVPRFTTSLSTTPTAQNVAPAETDIADAFLQYAVGWTAGIVTVSLQAFMQSWDNELELMAAEVLGAAFTEDLEAQCFTGTGASAQVLGILNVANLVNVTYTDASPTPSKFILQALAPAIAQFSATRKKSATGIFMRPERWSWIANGEDAQGRSIVNVTGPSPAGTPAPGGRNEVGRIGGIPVFVTTGIPDTVNGNQDEVVITRLADHRLYAGEPMFSAFEDSSDAASLSVVLAYSASTVLAANRFASVAISGTGLVMPAGF